MIPIKEFVQLIEDAEEAFKKNNFEAIGRINTRLSDVGASIYWEEGTAYFLTMNPNERLPFEDSDA